MSSFDVRMPKLGLQMEAATVTEWLVAEGDAVDLGQPLLEVETEKSTMVLEAEASGVLVSICVEQGEEAEVGALLATIGEAGTPSTLDRGEQEQKSAVGDRTPETASGAAAADTPGTGERTQVPPKASPVARRIAEEHQIDLSEVHGSGRDGRIVSADLERTRLLSARTESAPEDVSGDTLPDVEVVALTPLRKTITRRLTEAWRAPAFQISMTVDMTSAQRLRARLVAAAIDDRPRPTVSDLLMMAVARGLVRYPHINAAFAEDALHIHRAVNIGLAVATERGLVVPVIRNADSLPIERLADTRARLVARSRSGALVPYDMDDGTFTISNLGMLGVDGFTAVLNPPQAAILAAGAVREQPMVIEGGLVVRPAMTLTLTCDHRAIDGAGAAEFLGLVRHLLTDADLAELSPVGGDDR